MTVRVIFKQGEPRVVEGENVSDPRLINRNGQRVVIESRKDPLHSVIFVRAKGARHGLLTRLYEGQPYPPMKDCQM